MVKPTNSLLALTFISIQMVETKKVMPAEMLQGKSRPGKHKSFLFTLKGLLSSLGMEHFIWLALKKVLNKFLLPKCSQIFFPWLFVF